MCNFEGHINELGRVGESNFANLVQNVLSLDELWDIEDEKKPNKFDCFTTTKHIIFQFPESFESHTKSKYTYLWDEWKSIIEPVINEVTSSYNYKQGKTTRIMLAKISAGGEICMHIDGAPAADVPHKIHVPIKTDNLAEFILEDSSYHLKYGEAYEVNNKIMHGVKNASENERIHLIFDYYDAAAA